MRALIFSCLLSSAAAMAADAETFHGWSKDGSWLVYEQHHDERNELYFCATDSGVNPSWPAALNDLDRADGTLSCVRFLDPNKAPYQWKNQLVLPAPSQSQAGITISTELSTDGETPGFVLVQGDKKQACYASATRDDSKLGKTWFHPSTKFVAVMIDGNFRHCVVTLKPGKPTGKKR
ncbi:MAG TPA: hypothetical protein VGD87_01605 [Archangium sp.]|jgi:hypothetical protein